MSILIIFNYCFPECLSLTRGKPRHRGTASSLHPPRPACPHCSGSLFLLHTLFLSLPSLYFCFFPPSLTFSFLSPPSPLLHLLPFHPLSPKTVLHGPLCWEGVDILFEVPLWWRPGTTQVAVWFSGNFWARALPHLATRGCVCAISVVLLVAGPGMAPVLEEEVA